MSALGDRDPESYAAARMRELVASVADWRAAHGEFRGVVRDRLRAQIRDERKRQRRAWLAFADAVARSRGQSNG